MEGRVLRSTNPSDETDLWEAVAEPKRVVAGWQGFVEEDDAAPSADLPRPIDRLRRWVAAALAEEREVGTAFLLTPMAFGAGSVVYFTAPREPSLVAAVTIAFALSLFTLAMGWRGRPVLIALSLAAMGFAAGKLRTETLSTPVVSRAVAGTLTGTVVWTERRAGGSVRYTIAVHSFDVRGVTAPRLVRIVDRKPRIVLSPGSGIEARTRLLPASGPVVPGGYDFAFYSWFEGRGAIGSVLGEAKRIRAPPEAPGTTIARWRFAIAERISSGMDAAVAPLARALIVGDRSGIADEVAEDLRLSGLAHILAISGLHMMLVTGLVFVTLRKVSAFASVESLRFPVKKLAAMGALIFAAVYLALSGMNVSTQRAFVMVCIMLGAVLLDRRAAVLRNVAIAALVVLAWQPEAIFAPGFQMSFAAAAALVSAYGLLLRWRERRAGERKQNGWVRSSAVWLAGLSFTSLVAGFATAPFAAFHFHRIALLSLVANLAAMPIVTFAVMPLAVLCVIAMPFGLEVLVMPLFGWSLEAVVRIAGKVASWGLLARTGLISPVAFLLTATGFCILVLMRTPLRLLGLLPCAIALVVPSATRNVVATINEDGRNVTVLERDRLVFSAGKPTSFVNKLVAESFPLDGGTSSRFRCDRFGCAHDDGASTFAVSKDERSLRDDCKRADVIVSRFRAECPTGSDALVLDRRILSTRGSTLIRRDEDGRFSLEHAYGPHPRPWTRHRFER